ncbi:MAG TPA: zf-HC2 domain-containing protein [Solirubrobacteraceae bacterium]|jgi:hypothetical protein|nr:zf-HC2 domain-containing protein [Solirubrobacteraceae bacterium]
MSIREDVCARAGDASLYVLGELAGRRKESFERHARHCEECADEVVMLRQIESAEPLLGAAYLPPEEEDDPGRKAPTPTLSVAAANARAARLAAERAAAIAEANGEAPPNPRPALRTIPGGAGAPPRNTWNGLMGGRRLLKTPMPRSAMISFLALGVLAIATVAMTSRAASLRYFRIQAGWAKGGAAVKLIGNQLELLVEDMPRPAAGTGYQVWVVESASKKQVPTTAWIHLNPLRQAGVNVPGNFHNWDAVAIYSEPLTGRDTVGRAAVAVGDLRGVK